MKELEKTEMESSYVIPGPPAPPPARVDRDNYGLIGLIQLFGGMLFISIAIYYFFNFSK